MVVSSVPFHRSLHLLFTPEERRKIKPGKGGVKRR
jgi:hypothetical protein